MIGSRSEVPADISCGAGQDQAAAAPQAVHGPRHHLPLPLGRAGRLRHT